MTTALAQLPRLGVGISAEPGSAAAGIDALAFVQDHPGLVHFVEYGADLARGLDDHVRRWAAAGRATTYHFLDLNLEDPGDADDDWLRDTAEAARAIGAAWLCGDAGLWHFGARDRGHQMLLPPILTRDSADACAESILKIEGALGLRVLPENPPGAFYVGDLHILDYFARVSEASGCGLLLDCAHLAMFQRLRGLPPIAALDGFPLDRVVEIHVAGGAPVDIEGLALVDDAHNPEPLPDTWQIVEAVLPRATSLRAIVYECEKNAPDEVLENFRRLNRMFPS
ncbi:MAG TPA: DUF692 family protein [Polyangia bacterium]|nr:DUF692 family protein [Polyangia bacterium]